MLLMEQGLSRLDVVDLHDNLLDSIEGLEHLARLRVLNLAGNRIGHLCCLSSLTNLAELNLKQNFISSLEAQSIGYKGQAGIMAPTASKQTFPSGLRYLFLSHNRC